MLIINADDYGRNRFTTDRIIYCYSKGYITSASAMVFMADSQRASTLALELGIDVGLHLNFTQELDQSNMDTMLIKKHAVVKDYLNGNRYNFFVYNPFIKGSIEYVFRKQIDEYVKLYGEEPSRIDGHHHMHLCANMLLGALIPEGKQVRRNFTYSSGEKSLLNRLYRSHIDQILKRRYKITDYFFSLSESMNSEALEEIFVLAKKNAIEIETHPEKDSEYEWLIRNSMEKFHAMLK